MKRAIYLPLNIAILCGLVLSVFAASPVVYGDNVPSCQGNGSSSGAKVTLAGRVIIPSTLLRTANGQPCSSNETGLNLVSTRRTLIVSPNGTPTQNGAALLDAMTAISNTSPSASNPWLLKLEPGNYDVGGSLLVLKPYVDLEGSGQDSTTISSTVTNTGSSPTQGALIVASNSEVRFLSLFVNSASTNNSVGIFVNGWVVNARLSYLSITAAGGNFNYALFNYGNIRIQGSSLNAINSAHGAYVIYNTNGATLTVQDSVLNGSGIYSSYAISNNRNNTTTVQNSTLNVSAGNGISVLSAAIYNTQSTTTVYNSVLKSANSGTGSSGSFGVWNSTNGVITIRNSYLKSSASQSSYGLLNAGGTAKVAASQLSGSSGNVNGSGIICVASYNGNFSPLNTSCG